jgi:hypothetical protein
MTIFRFVLEARELRRFQRSDTMNRFMPLALDEPAVTEITKNNPFLCTHRPVMDWLWSEGITLRPVVLHEARRWPVVVNGCQFVVDLTVAPEIVSDDDAVRLSRRFPPLCVLGKRVGAVA